MIPSSAFCVNFLSSCVFSRKCAARCWMDWMLVLGVFSSGSVASILLSDSPSRTLETPGASGSVPVQLQLKLGSPLPSTLRCFRYICDRNDSYLLYGSLVHPGIGHFSERWLSAAWVFPMCQSTAENIGLANDWQIVQQYMVFPSSCVVLHGVE